LRTWWFDPRTGIGRLQGEIGNRGHQEFRPPSCGRDWVLVLDDPTRNFPPPGLA
jgi:hypothetical protein